MGRKRALTQATSDDAIEKKRKSFSSQPVADKYENKQPGVIIGMVLKNFMCHSYLEVRFLKNINFVIGKNGSGKSAILTALVVGLAGRASATNRGNSIKKFIKTGKTSGSIEITLCNTGCNAYKPSVYGNEITIVRMFTVSGSGTYKIKSLGQVISQSAREVQNILSYLNVQVNNLVCILNQDTARNFLSSNDSEQKFMLFMKGTGLEGLADECQKMRSSYQELRYIWEEKRELYKKLKQQMEDYKRKLEYHKSITNFENKYTQLAVEVLWAAVQESEAKYKEQEAVVTELRKLVDKYEDISKNRSQKDEDIRTKVSEIEHQIGEIRQTSNTQAGLMQDIDQQLQRFQEMIFDRRIEKDNLIQNINTNERNVEALQKEIKNFVQNLTKIEQEQLVRKKEIAACTEQLKVVQDTLETTQNELFQLKSSINKVEQEENDLGREKGQLQREFDVTNDDITALKRKSPNSLHLYGADMQRVVDAIKANQQNFKKMPKGPLGVFITIKDKKWAVAVEGLIGMGLLHSFTVDNVSDNRLLIQILDKYWTSARPPTVITSKFINAVHDFAPNLVHAPPDCIPLCEMIEVKNPVVMNCLIDQCSIENILLIPSSNRAIDLMSEEQNVPINCRRAVTIKGDQFYPDPNYRSYCSSYHQARFIAVNKAEVISYHQEKLHQIRTKIVSVENQLNSVNVNKRNQQQKLQEIVPKQEELKQKYVALKKNLDKLQMSDEPELANYESLEEELKLIKEQIQEKTIKVEQIDSKMSNLKEEVRQLENKKKDLLTNIQCLETRLQPLVTEITRLSEEQKELNINRSFEKQRIEKAKNNLNQGNEILAGIKSEMTTQISLAGGEDKRVHTDKATKEIEVELKQIDKQLQELNKKSGDIKEIASKYKIIVDKHTETMQLISSIEATKQEMTMALQKRSKHFQNVQDYFAYYVSYNFKQILDYRQYKGNININFKEKKLDLVVMPQHGLQGHTVTTNLSGGERSFSTVAFLYSLWKVLSCPFYFLDEFDVFMDKVNRRKVMEVLIHHARQRPNMQFVFLTPQDVSFIHEEDISINRLEDPERKDIEL